jgi:hypothetical protein
MFSKMNSLFQFSKGIIVMQITIGRASRDAVKGMITLRFV